MWKSSVMSSPFLLALLVLSTESRFAHQPTHTQDPILLRPPACRDTGPGLAWIHTSCLATKMLNGGRNGNSGTHTADFWRQRVRLASQSVGPLNGGDAESSSTWKWLQEKTQGRTTQFDILLKRSNNRIEVERQKLELKSRQKEIVKLQRTLVNSSDIVASYQQLVADIETKLIDQTNLPPGDDSEEAARVEVLKSQLQEAQENLADFQMSVRSAQAQTDQLIVELKRSESQLEELRIRNELEAERDRQSLRLKAMLEAITHGTDSYKSLHVLSPLLSQLPLHAPEAAASEAPALGAEEEESAGVDSLAEAKRGRVRALLLKQLGKHGAMLEDLVMDSAASEEQMQLLFKALREEGGLSNDKIANVVQVCPELMAASVEEQVRPALTFLLKEVKLDRDTAGSVIATQPSILGKEVAGELRPALQFLSKEVRIPQSKIPKVVQQCPRMLVLDPEDGPRAVSEFLACDVGLSRDNVGKAVASFPQILTMGPDTHLRRTFDWLCSIGVPKSKLERVVRLHPKTLGYSLNNNLQPTVRYLWEDVGVPPEKLGKMIASFPQLLGLSVQQNLRPMVQYLLDDVGVEPARLNKMFCTFPQLFGLSLENNIRPHVEYLVDEVGIPADRIGKAVVTFPHLLAYNLEDKLRPTVDFLHTLGIPKDRMGKLVATHPQILGYSVDDKLVPTVRYLVDDVGVEAARIGEVVERCPKLLGCSIDKNLRPTVQFLIDEVGIRPSQIGQVVSKYPSLLGLSIDNNLRPKLEYLIEEVNVEHDVIKNLLVTCPQLLAYSLENRIKPRHRLLLGKGLKLGLHSMLAPTDIAFYERYGDGLGRVPSIKASLNVVDSASGNYYWDGGGGEGSELSGGRLETVRRRGPGRPAARTRSVKRAGRPPASKGTQTTRRRKQVPQPQQQQQSQGPMQTKPA